MNNIIESAECTVVTKRLINNAIENLTLEQIKALYAQKGGDLAELISEQEAVIDARDFLRNLADKVKASSEYTGANGSLIDDIDIGLINAINLLNTIIHTKPINPDDVAKHGYVLVPIEPTEKMCVAGLLVSEAEHDPAGVYKAMLLASNGKDEL